MNREPIPPCGKQESAVGVVAGAYYCFGRHQWRIDEKFDGPVLRDLLSHLDSLPNVPSAYLRRPGQTAGSEVFRVRLPGTLAPALIVKRYVEFKIVQILKRLVRGSRGKRAYRWAQTLRQLGICALEPVAAGTLRWRPWRSYFVSVEITPAETLLEAAQGDVSSLGRRGWLRQLARIMATLHDNGVSYGDAHLTNFVVQGAGTSSEKLVLSDLDGLRRFHWVTARRAARDLRRLRPYTPAVWSEQVRFLIEYCRSRRRRVGVREMVRHIGQASRNKGL